LTGTPFLFDVGGKVVRFESRLDFGSDDTTGVDVCDLVSVAIRILSPFNVVGWMHCSTTLEGVSCPGVPEYSSTCRGRNPAEPIHTIRAEGFRFRAHVEDYS
jgi:hypothetical protein